MGGGLFILDHGIDPFFERAGGHEFVDQDIAFLADPVGAVGGLVFDGGIPPAVEMDDVAGGGESEAGAAGFYDLESNLARLVVL